MQDVIKKHQGYLDSFSDVHERHDRLCELNVIEQVMHVAETTVIQDAWARGQHVTIHGWCYSLANGLVQDMHISACDEESLQNGYSQALARLPKASSAA